MASEKLNNHGENKEIQKEALGRAIGRATIDADYLSSDEAKLNRDAKRIEAEQAQNEEQIKAILEQFKAAKQERARLLAEKQKREEEARKIEEQRRQKSIAMKRGLIGMTGWYNKHPEELGEILHPDLKPQLEQLQKEHAENGKSFYNAIKDSLRLENIDMQLAALERERSEIVKDMVMVPEGESDEAVEEFETAMPIDTPEMYEDDGAELSGVASEGVGNDGVNNVSAANEQIIDSNEKDEAIKSEGSENKNELVALAEDGNEIKNAENNNEAVDWNKVNIDKFMSAIGYAYMKGLSENLKQQAESSPEEAIEESAEKAKSSRISRIKEKWNNARKGAKRIMVSAAALAMAVLAVSGCATNLDNKNADKMDQQELVETAPDIDLAMKAEAKENVNTVNYYMINHDGGREDLSLDLSSVDKDKVGQTSNPFEREVMEKGGQQTADNKENPGSFGPVLSSEELSGDIDGLEKNNLGDLMERMSEQPELLAYYGSQIGAFDEINLPGVELATEREGFSTESISKDARTITNLSSEQRQKLLDATANKIKEMAEGGEMRAVMLPGGTSYITAHIDKTDDGQYEFAAGVSHKETDYAVMKLIKGGVDVYDTGETKLNILQAHGLVDKEAALGSDAANEAMDKYTVLGLRNKCGGQFVIVEKGTTVTVDGKSVNAEDSDNPDVVPQTPDNDDDSAGNESAGNESAGNESAGNESAGNESAGNETSGDEPTGTEIVGKTSTNPWERNNPSILPITKSFEQISAENNGARVVQRGQEQEPEVDTSHVNTNPEDQQDWAEQATKPEADTGTGGTVDQSADSDAAAAEMLRQTEAALRNAQ